MLQEDLLECLRDDVRGRDPLEACGPAKRIQRKRASQELGTVEEVFCKMASLPTQ